jgi:alkyl sulfatase BDS1-like metallo-beta-lactamase superfamily hydrolase
VFESVILRQRSLADAMEHREITIIGGAKAVSDLLALLVDFEPGFPIVEPGRLLLTECGRWVDGV